MKKGFTLVELLMVMVIVSILVTVALPAYKVSMERGRALEGMANIAAVAEAANVFYIRNGNSYGTTVSELSSFALGSNSDGGTAGMTISKFFNKPTITITSNGTSARITIIRKTGDYTFSYVCQNGFVTQRTCSGNARYCKAFGF